MSKMQTENLLVKEFKELVNMSADELSKWLNTEESLSVGWKDESDESVGHQSGQKIVKILRHSNHDEQDIDHMKRVISYIKRHSAQKPQKEKIENSRWRYSLMNWGHDPLK
jgi:hypothetical protein